MWPLPSSVWSQLGRVSQGGKLPPETDREAEGVQPLRGPGEAAGRKSPLRTPLSVSFSSPRLVHVSSPARQAGEEGFVS